MTLTKTEKECRVLKFVKSTMNLTAKKSLMAQKLAGFSWQVAKNTETVLINSSCWFFTTGFKWASIKAFAFRKQSWTKKKLHFYWKKFKVINCDATVSELASSPCAKRSSNINLKITNAEINNFYQIGLSVWLSALLTTLFEYNIIACTEQVSILTNLWLLTKVLSDFSVSEIFLSVLSLSTLTKTP